MKKFLYLDYDEIKSILAQSENGVIEKVKEENQDSKSVTSQSDLKAEINSSNYLGGVPLLKKIKSLLPNLNYEKKAVNNQIENNVTTYEKVFGDKMFDQAYEYIKNKIVDANSEFDYGKYTELRRVFTIINLNDFKDLDKLKNFFKDDEMQKNNIEQKINDLNLSCEFNNYEIMLSAYDGFLIPMNTKCLLENPKNFGFLFEGEFNCVGIMTNLIGKDSAPIGYDDIPSLFRCRVNEALINFLPTKEEVITVIKPIAIYYDTD